MVEEVPSGMSKAMRGDEGEDVCERKIFMVVVKKAKENGMLWRVDFGYLIDKTGFYGSS